MGGRGGEGPPHANLQQRPHCSLPFAAPHWPSGQLSTSRAADLGSIPAFGMHLSPGEVIPVT